MKYLLIFFSIILLSSNSFAQSQFQFSIGGTANDAAYSIVLTRDGGYAIAGHTFSSGAGNADMSLVKFDPTGMVNWSRTIGGALNDRARGLVHTNDDGFVIAGFSYSFNQTGASDIYLVKYDYHGNKLWSKVISLFSNGFRRTDAAYSVIETSDGGLAIAGSSFVFDAEPFGMYALFMKLDSEGNVQWTRLVGDNQVNGKTDIAYSLVQTFDQGYAIAGYTRTLGPGTIDMYIVKFDSVGSHQWSKTIGGFSEEKATSIIQSSDGGLVIAGETISFGGGGLFGNNLYIVKLDTAGNLEWTRSLGGSRSDFANSIFENKNGEFVVSGSTNSYGNNQTWPNLIFIKLDADGTVIWNRTAGGANSDFGRSVIQTIDGGFIAAGETFSYSITPSTTNMFVIKIDSAGESCGMYNTFSSENRIGGFVTAVNSLVHFGQTVSEIPSDISGSGTTLNIVCSQLVGLDPLQTELPLNFRLHQNYPNPFNPITLIKFDIPMSGDVKLSVFDITGNEVSTLVNSRQEAGSYSIEFNGINLPSGVYFYELRVGEFVKVMRMVLLK